MSGRNRAPIAVQLRNPDGVLREVKHPVVCIVNNTFQNMYLNQPMYKLERKGWQKDVSKIKRVFKDLGFHVRDAITNQNRETILRSIRDTEYRDADGKFTRPDVLVLFIMSHGNENGVIYTDWAYSAGENGARRAERRPGTDATDMDDFESYTTEQVFTQLRENELLHQCHKLIVIQACRGKFKDVLTEDAEQGPSNPFRLHTLKPPENSIILYSSVEGLRTYRNKDSGSLLVQPLCDLIAAAKHGDDILTLITAAKSKVCESSILAKNRQTPEVVYNAKDTLVMKNLLEGRKSDYEEFVFNWGKQEDRVNGCGALIKLTSYDETELVGALENNMGVQMECFQQDSVQDAILKIKKESAMADFMIIFIVCKLVIGGGVVNEVSISTRERPTPIGDVIKKFLGANNEHLGGQPKFFFFVDPTVNKIKSKHKIRLPSESGDDSEVAAYGLGADWTQHSFTISFVCHGLDDLGNLIKTLSSPKLRKEGIIFEAELAKCVRLCNKNKGMLPELRTTFASTMPKLVNLPCARHAYLPQKIMMSNYVGYTFMGDGVTSLVNSFLPKPLGKKHIPPVVAWLLAAMPGQGKTRFAMQFARAVSRCLGCQLVQVTLCDFSEYFEECKSGKRQISIEHFCQEGETPNRKEKRMAFVFDGYERVAPFYSSELLKLFHLIHTKRHSMLVTTRVGHKPNTTIFSPLKLVPFEEEDQMKFLHRFHVEVAPSDFKKLKSMFEPFKTETEEEFLGNALNLKKIAQFNACISTLNNFPILESICKALVRRALVEFEDVDERRPRLQTRINNRLKLHIAIVADMLQEGLLNIPDMSLASSVFKKVDNTGIMKIIVNKERREINYLFNYSCFQYFLVACVAHATNMVTDQGSLTKEFKTILQLKYGPNDTPKVQYVQLLAVNCHQHGGKKKYPMLKFDPDYELE